MCWRKYEQQNPKLKKYLKSPVSEYPTTSNMVNGLKHFWNLHDTIFNIFIDKWEDYWVGKSFS